MQDIRKYRQKEIGSLIVDDLHLRIQSLDVEEKREGIMTYTSESLAHAYGRAKSDFLGSAATDTTTRLPERVGHCALR